MCLLEPSKNKGKVWQYLCQSLHLHILGKYHYLQKFLGYYGPAT